MMDLEQSKVLQMINAIEDAIDGKQLQQQPRGKCLCSIDCRCTACTDDCSRERFCSYTITDLNSFTKGIKIEKFEIGISPSNFVVIESAELFEELSLDVLFMESENINNTCKVFDTMTERNVAVDSFGSGYTRENFENKSLDETFMEHVSSALVFIVPDPTIVLDELLELDIMPTSCLLTASSHYVYVKQNGATVTVFDPGGITLDMLEFRYMKFIELLNATKISVGISFPLFEYCLYHAKVDIPINAKTRKEWIRKPFIEVSDVLLLNFKARANELLDPLAAFSMITVKEEYISLFQGVRASVSCTIFGIIEMEPLRKRVGKRLGKKIVNSDIHEVMQDQCVSGSKYLARNYFLAFLSVSGAYEVSFASSCHLFNSVKPANYGILVWPLLTNEVAAHRLTVIIHTAIMNFSYKMVDANFVYKKGKVHVVISDGATAGHGFSLIPCWKLELIVDSIPWPFGQIMPNSVGARLTTFRDLLNRFNQLFCTVKHGLLTDFSWTATIQMFEHFKGIEGIYHQVELKSHYYAEPWFPEGGVVLFKAKDLLEAARIQLKSTVAQALSLLVLGRYPIIGDFLVIPFDPGGGHTPYFDMLGSSKKVTNSPDNTKALHGNESKRVIEVGELQFWDYFTRAIHSNAILLLALAFLGILSSACYNNNTCYGFISNNLVDKIK